MYLEKARQYALHRLAQELAPGLCYHCVSHTRDEVVPAAQSMAEIEGLNAESLDLLLTAAWFHDLGYVKQPLYHELISVQIAKEVLPDFNYTDEQIEIVTWAILATALPQAPKSLLEEILVDADLEVLGREDFIQRNQDLRQELAYLGKEFSNREWYTGQLKFIQEHQYFTQSARALRDSQKAANIETLGHLLEGLD